MQRPVLNAEAALRRTHTDTDMDLLSDADLQSSIQGDPDA